MWHAERRRLADLVPLENNPFGRITTENRRRLEIKLQELGVFEAATVDTDNILLTFNKRHNLLMGLGRAEEEFEVMVPNRPLTEDERKKIILASNINEGQWIEDLLRSDYADVLADVGLELPALEQLMKDAGIDAQEQKPEYPIVAEFSEKYSSFIIVCRNDIDANNVAQILGIEQMQSYKSGEVGKTHVIEARAFAEKCKSK
ncbi:hypothetical protein LJY25_08185 [Hymenobacter sp. BT175]|nr:hypothetical protein [Hymenobacter translucens]